MKIIFVTQNAGSYISGGRLYSWFIAHCLAKLGNIVTILTNSLPIFDRDFINFPGRENIKIYYDNFNCMKNKDALNHVRESNLIICTPISGVDIAVTLGSIYKKDVVAFIFEPLNMIEEAISSGIEIRFNPADSSIISYQKQIIKTKAIVCNNKYTEERTKEWLSQCGYKGKILHLYNGINSHILDNIKVIDKNERENSVVYCSRTDKYKGFGDIPYIFCQTQNKPKIHYISGFIDKGNKLVSDFFQLCDAQKMNIEVHDKITDKQKFEIIAKSKVLFFPSRFEGFGLPPAEAFYLKTPVVCYDLPVLKEVYGEFPHYMPFGDVDYGITLFDQLFQDDDFLYRNIEEAEKYVKNFCTIENYSKNLDQLLGVILGLAKMTSIVPELKNNIETGGDKVLMIVIGDETKDFTMSLKNQSNKNFEKINVKSYNDIDLLAIKRERIIICDGRIVLSRFYVEEMIWDFASDRNCIVSNYKINNERVCLPECTYESLLTYPTLFSGSIACKKDILSKYIKVQDNNYWELLFLLNLLRNKETIFVNRKFSYDLDEKYHKKIISPVVESTFATELKKNNFQILKISDSIYKLQETKKYDFKDCIFIIPVRSNKNLPKLFKTLLNDIEKDIIVCHHVPDGKWNEDVMKLCSSNDIPVIKVEGDFNYSKMNNKSISKFRENRHKYVFLMNDDVILHKNSLNSIHSIFDYRFNKVGVVGSKLLYPNKDCIFPVIDIMKYPFNFAEIQHAGVHLIKDRMCTHRCIHWNYGNISSNILKECQAVTFALVGIDIKCYDEILLDESLPNDYNDIDFCIRASNNGWKIIYNPYAIAFHTEAASRKEFKTLGDKTGHLFFQKRHESLLTRQISYNELRNVENIGF